MKSFFWKKIMPYALLNQPTVSFWEQRPELISLDFDSVCNLFRAKLAAKKSKVAAAATGAQTLAVLDMKRATSVGVLMSKLHLPHSRLAKAVFELDETVRFLALLFCCKLLQPRAGASWCLANAVTWHTRCDLCSCCSPWHNCRGCCHPRFAKSLEGYAVPATAVREFSVGIMRTMRPGQKLWTERWLQVFTSKDDIDAIQKCLPTDDEKLKLAPYRSGARSLKDLAPVEKFLLDLSNVPQIEERLKTFGFAFSVPETLAETKAVLVTRRDAAVQVRTVMAQLALACCVVTLLLRVHAICDTAVQVLCQSLTCGVRLVVPGTRGA